MAEIRIGGETHAVPKMTIKTMKRVARLAARLDVLQAQAERSLDSMDQAMDVACEIVEAWFAKTKPDLTREFVEDNMTVDEVQDIGGSIMASLREAGLIVPGEPSGAAADAAPVAPQNPTPEPSTSNSTESSASSAPPASAPATLSA